MRKLCIILSAAGLSGCETLAALTFSPLEQSGVGDQKVYASFVPVEGRADLSNLVARDKQLTDAISTRCGSDPGLVEQQISTAGLPIVAALGKLLFDFGATKARNRVDALKKSAQASYSGTMIADNKEDIASRRCLLIMRVVKETADASKSAVLKMDGPSFAALLRIQKHGDAFTFMPVFVIAKNAVAVTGKNPPEVTVAIAVAVKSLVATSAKGPTLVSNGQSVVSLSTVPVAQRKDGGYATYACPETVGSGWTRDPDCLVSDLIANPAGGPFSLSISVTETGKLGSIDVDAATAEIKAIDEALGPAISEAITTKYKKD